MKQISTLLELGISKTSRILVLMPHPDDEAVFISGLLQKLSSQSIPTRVLTLTAGEKSTLRYTLSPSTELSLARKQELTNAFTVLKINNFQILEYPDGGIEENIHKIKLTISTEIKQFKPTHLVTLEPDGIYGHPDHIALTQAVIKIAKPPLKLLYATVSPRYIFPKARAMAKKKVIKPLVPEYRLQLSVPESIGKVKAILSHKSQFYSPLPLAKSTYFFLKNDMLFHEHFATHPRKILKS